MSRSCAYRRTCPDGVSWHQDQALSATIFILRQTGPTGFLLKEDGEQGKFKVFLGDPHSCTCPTFQRERDLCQHICWVLLRKFRVPRANPVTWQKGIVEREINGLLRGIVDLNVRPSAPAQQLARAMGNSGEGESGDGSGKEFLEQRPIAEEDVCPICQEEFLAKHQPVTYCKFGCGNSVHIKCMKVWADHQKTMVSDEIKCPLCREDFGPIELLNQEYRNTALTRARQLNQHLGTICKKCHVCPIAGKCYKCTTCQEYHLCQTCYNTPAHNQHSFAFREENSVAKVSHVGGTGGYLQKPSQRWRPAPRGSGSVLPEAMVNQLMARDLSDQDYDMLLQLDNQEAQGPSDLTEETIKLFPQERVRQNSAMLAPGQQCRVCLRAYHEGDFIRRLPCRHKFHRDCIDNWLLHQRANCPIDGTVYTNDSVRQIREAERQRSQHLRQEQQASQKPKENVQSSDQPALEIPGIGIAKRTNQSPSRSGNNSGNPRSRDKQSLVRGPVLAGQERRFEVISGPTSTSNLTVNGLSYENTFDYTISSMSEANSASSSRAGRRNSSTNSPNHRSRHSNSRSPSVQIVDNSEPLHFPLEDPPSAVHGSYRNPVIIPSLSQESDQVSSRASRSHSGHSRSPARVPAGSNYETTSLDHNMQNAAPDSISNEIDIETEAAQRHSGIDHHDLRDKLESSAQQLLGHQGVAMNASCRGSDQLESSAQQTLGHQGVTMNASRRGSDQLESSAQQLLGHQGVAMNASCRGSDQLESSAQQTLGHQGVTMNASRRGSDQLESSAQQLLGHQGVAMNASRRGSDQLESSAQQLLGHQGVAMNASRRGSDQLESSAQQLLGHQGVMMNASRRGSDQLESSAQQMLGHQGVTMNASRRGSDQLESSAQQTLGHQDVTMNASRRGSGNSAGSAGSHRKPPSGAASDVSGSSLLRQGRSRTQPLSRQINSSESRRNRSASREREQPKPQDTRNLFIGNDPSTSTGFTNDFVVSNFIKGQLRKMNNKVVHNRQRVVGQSDPRHRWGNVQEMQGDSNDIVLSGSAVTTMNSDHPP